ncbi:MAG TPA: glycosyl hydrolase [Thermoanaerobaculia bacterium]|nr:glycosyl hydrolase [Thermoanaerobaculia bacterium]
MKPKTRYATAFFALGWMLLAGIAFQFGLASTLRRFISGTKERVLRVGQYFSDVEGDAMRRVRHSSRLDYLEPMRPILDSPAALRNPTQILFGAYDGGLPDSFHNFTILEERLDYRFPLISFYSAWGDRADQQFPMRMVESIHRMGSVPIITWEPWVVDFDGPRRELPPVEEREYGSLRSIARGEYDFYIVPWARAAAAYGHPIFLRFAHEMNDPYRYPWGPQNGNRPDDFTAAWIHVHQIFQKMEATNVLWVWSPHISMPWLEYYYPGDQYVDWIGINLLNYGTVASWSRWWSFHQILEKSYGTLVTLEKPLMISELGTLAVGGDMAEWYRQAFYQLSHHYGSIKAVVLFNDAADRSMSPDWPLNWSVTQSPEVAEVVSREIARASAF